MFVIADLPRTNEEITLFLLEHSDYANTITFRERYLPWDSSQVLFDTYEKKFSSWINFLLDHHAEMLSYKCENSLKHVKLYLGNILIDNLYYVVKDDQISITRCLSNKKIKEID